jgi:hypothetical protein
LPSRSTECAIPALESKHKWLKIGQINPKLYMCTLDIAHSFAQIVNSLNFVVAGTSCVWTAEEGARMFHIHSTYVS